MGKVIQLNQNNEDFYDEVTKLTQLCHEDLESINTLIIEKLDSNVPLIKEIAPYLIIDPVANQFMDGATIDYDTSGMSPTFIFSDVFKGQGGSGMCGGCGGAGH